MMSFKKWNFMPKLIYRTWLFCLSMCARIDWKACFVLIWFCVLDMEIHWYSTDIPHCKRHLNNEKFWMLNACNGFSMRSLKKMYKPRNAKIFHVFWLQIKYVSTIAWWNCNWLIYRLLHRFSFIDKIVFKVHL